MRWVVFFSVARGHEDWVKRITALSLLGSALCEMWPAFPNNAPALSHPSQQRAGRWDSARIPNLARALKDADPGSVSHFCADPTELRRGFLLEGFSSWLSTAAQSPL